MAYIFANAGTAETNDLTFWPTQDSAGGGGPVSDSQAVAGSARSLRIIQGALAGAGSPDGVMNRQRRYSQYVRFTTLPTGSGENIICCNESFSFNNRLYCVQLGTDGKLSITDNGGTPIATGTTVLSVNTDYRISVAHNIVHNTAWVVTVYLNGVQEVTKDQGAIGSSQPAMLAHQWQNHVTGSLYIAHTVVDDGSSGEIGGGVANFKVAAKRPLSNGTTNGFTTQIGSGGSGYGTGHAPQVNELPLSNTNGWSMVGAGSAVTEEYTLEGAAVGDQDLTGATIAEVVGWIDAKSLASETASMVIAGSSFNVALTSTETAFFQPAAQSTYPSGGAGIGLITTTALTTVSLYECGVSIVYTPGTVSAISPRLLSLLGAG
jgi:hypothetical protein